MSQRIQPGNLVLYKSRPARVTEVSDKIEIAVAGGGKSRRVRDKDVQFLHPGPVADLDNLDAGTGDLDEARELLDGETVPLPELAELVYGDYTPPTAWSAWQLVADGLYFTGTPEAITARDPAEVDAEIAQREEKAAREAAWDGLIARLSAGTMAEEDVKELAEVERLALGRTTASRILQALSINETREHAHRLLTRVGYWPEEYNPHPARFEAPSESASHPVPDLPAEDRLDLTHLDAWAIDDEGSEDPDDAISIDGDRLWVHVADAASLVAPDSELDLEARSRGANLYLPEGVITMLPPRVTHQLGLGLLEVSPALSVGMRVDDEGHLHDIEVRLSSVRVTRVSYREANGRMDEPGFAAIHDFTKRFRARRFANDAARIDLPEVGVRLVDGDIRFKPIEAIPSREMVTDAMLMAGEAVARFALEHDIPVPFVGQPAPEEIQHPEKPSEMYAYRRLFKPSTASTVEQAHFGLGLPLYTRATSPLRRYFDLLTHQQLRSHLLGTEPVPRDALGQRIAEAATASGTVRRTERAANQHWKLVYLRRHPDWTGEAVVLALEERRAAVIIPELALETKLRRTPEMALDATLRIAVQGVDLADQVARFKVLS